MIQFPCLFPTDLPIANIRGYKLAWPFGHEPITACTCDLDLQAIALVESRNAFRRNDFFASVGAHLPEAYERGKLYDFHRFENGWFVHAPCEILRARRTGGRVSFRVDGWGDRGYNVILTGVRNRPASVTASGKAVEIEYHADKGLVIVPLRGPAGNVEFLAWWEVGTGELEAGAAIAACMKGLEAEEG